MNVKPNSESNDLQTQQNRIRCRLGWPVVLLFIAIIGANCQSLMKNGIFYDGADSVDAIPVDLFAPVRALVADEEAPCPPGFKNTVPVPGKENPAPTKKQDGPVTKTPPGVDRVGTANQQAALNCQKIKTTG